MLLLFCAAVSILRSLLLNTLLNGVCVTDRTSCKWKKNTALTATKKKKRVQSIFQNSSLVVVYTNASGCDNAHETQLRLDGSCLCLELSRHRPHGSCMLSYDEYQYGESNAAFHCNWNT